jgi:hypothetical protein
MQPEWTTGLCGRWRRRRDAPCKHIYLLTSFYFVCMFYKGDPYPENSRLGSEYFLCSYELARRGGSRFPLSQSTYLFEVRDGINEIQNKSKNHIEIHQSVKIKNMTNIALAVPP